MRSIYPLVAAACLLAAPLASAVECGGGGMVNLVAQREGAGGSGGFISTGAQLSAEVAGTYALSNGRRLELSDLQHDVLATFDNRRRVFLEEVGPHRYASHRGDVQLTWMPEGRPDTILLSYPADSKGRLRRGCS
ncbi:hypothetical protein [Massilia sp. BSC265]|uniref:hypothetical protein n=1 Tax=Massilia sp. BSC265 TaxID=1549812 RepID=UPI0004E8C918|nr:hypothetical protein [Massilia sp. BSC265]KFI08598.1 hypothetical protein JN27_03410 [Massilia sp. BSC265]